MPVQSANIKTYHFPLRPSTDGPVRDYVPSGVETCWSTFAGWFAGPWAIGSWVIASVIAGGLAFQIGMVYYFSAFRPRGPETIHQIYSFLAWLIMAGIFLLLGVPYVVWIEPFLSKYLGGSSSVPLAGRKPLLVVLMGIVTTVILLTAVLPSVDGNYADHMQYELIAAESAFLVGWVLGMTYCIVLAVSNPNYPIVHLAVTPALVAGTCALAAVVGAAAVKGWMISCNTGEDGGGPWDGCNGSLDGASAVVGGGGGGGSGGGGTTSPSDSCPCPNAAGTKCNCPFAPDCSIYAACYNPGGGSIPGACPHVSVAPTLDRCQSLNFCCILLTTHLSILACEVWIWVE